MLLIFIINNKMVKERLTRQKEIMEEEIKKLNGFFDAEELLKKSKIRDSKIGIATIYRFLKEQVKRNILHSYVCNRKTIYSVEKKSHCHFICEKTGKIIHFDLDNLNFLGEIRSKIPGEINSIQIEIKGVCNKCSGKIK